MPHDNVKVCEEIFGRLKTNHMMSPTLIQIDRANPWSACSAAIITDFLDSGHGEQDLLGMGIWLQSLVAAHCYLFLRCCKCVWHCINQAEGQDPCLEGLTLQPGDMPLSWQGFRHQVWRRNGYDHGGLIQTWGNSVEIARSLRMGRRQKVQGLYCPKFPTVATMVGSSNRRASG